MHNYLKAEISAGAIRRNVALLREQIGLGCKLCAVIKCNAYGHGQELLLPLMADLADWVGVATPAEALRLREVGYTGEILVFFSACTRSGSAGVAATMIELIRQHVTLTITSRWELDVLSAATRRTGETANIHICVDTGMTRSGARPEDVPALLREIQLDPGLAMTGIYSHFATADEADKSAAHVQIERFEAMLTRYRDQFPATLLRHLANSAAAIDLPDAHYDMVRPGIALYGYQPSDEMHNKLPLTPAMRLSAHVMQIQRVPAGTAVGYGGTFTTQRDSIIALVPVGYGDGYPRALSNVGSMKIRGYYAPIVGRVSMDQITLDVTDLPDVIVGDMVEIIAPDPAAPNSLETLARQAGCIPYEIMCRLGDRVRRFLVD